jgi:hypothetical protein
MSQKSIRVSKNLYVDQEFFQFLLNNESIISTILINLDLGQEMNYLSPAGIYDKISYLPMEKFVHSVEFDPYAKGIGRVTLKIGRFVNKFLSDEVMDKFGITKSHVEKFVNLYKSWFDTTKFVLKVVEGEEIKKWYNQKNYYTVNGNQIGTLWNSCMRYENRLKFLDLYLKNPNIKMLVMLQQIDDDWYVRSRALLWDGVEITKDYSNSLPNQIKVMDRIYSVFDSDVNTFKKWANENGYIPKFEQNAKSHQFFDIKGEVVRLCCKVKLESAHLSYYPYLDTFPFFNWSSKEISNDEFSFGWDYKLVQADGSLERPPQEDQQDEETGDDW